MQVKKIIPVLITVVFLAAVVCSAADKVDLKLRLKAGESHEMKMTQTQNISQTMNGQEMNMKQTQEMVMGIDCLSVDADGVMDIEMGYKSVKMAMDGPMGHMEFDSANPKPTDPNKPHEKMMTAMVSAMAGCKFQMKVKPTGETFNIRGMGEMLAKVKKEIPDGPGTERMDKFIDKMFDEKQLEELTGNMMEAFPPEPISVGDAWYDTQSINFMMPIDVDTTYILKGRKDGIAYIDAAAKLDMGDSSKPIEIDPENKMSIQLSGTINTTSEVDEKTGLTQKSNITMNLSGVMRMEANEQMPQGMTIPMTIKGEAFIELIK
ncbi:MAG: hypothetical protein CVV39_03670 [Planctomycetes bacterium HGW-Planctomycetes-1]|nr:MAG: hypothetical protein CVV39_03670 [Planctomycetes bacterium HGW-Planctomycetes-1]